MSLQSLNPPRPELTALMNTFARWETELRRVAPHPARADTESFEDYAKAHNLPQPPQSYLLLANLPTVPVADLPADEQNCSICLHSFIAAEQESGTKEVPVRLPCKHIMGNCCLRRWVYPYGPGEVCPICRADCLLDDIGYNARVDDYESDEAIEITLDEKIWADHEGGSEMSKSRRLWVRVTLYCVVMHRLELAKEELDFDFYQLNARRGGASESGIGLRDTRARWGRRVRAVDDMAGKLADGWMAHEANVELMQNECERERQEAMLGERVC